MKANEVRRQKGYRLPRSLVRDVDVLAAERGVRPCRVVEEALRATLYSVRSGQGALGVNN